MIVGFGETGMDKRHVIHMVDHVGEDFGYPGARLSLFFKLEWRLHQGANFAREKPGELVKALKFLTIMFRKLWLVIPGIHLALTAIHEKPDHRFGLAGKMALPWS